jgi:hypothetical protein
VRYAERRLDAAGRAQVEAHLAACAECRHAAAETARLSFGLSLVTVAFSLLMFLPAGLAGRPAAVTAGVVETPRVSALTPHVAAAAGGEARSAAAATRSAGAASLTLGPVPIPTPMPGPTQ